MISFVTVPSNLQSFVLDAWVKRGAELSTNHHPVSWISYRPGKAKQVVRMNLESLVEAPVFSDLHLTPL